MLKALEETATVSNISSLLTSFFYNICLQIHISKVSYIQLSFWMSASIYNVLGCIGDQTDASVPHLWCKILTLSITFDIAESPSDARKNFLGILWLSTGLIAARSWRGFHWITLGDTWAPRLRPPGCVTACLPKYTTVTDVKVITSHDIHTFFDY